MTLEFCQDFTAVYMVFNTMAASLLLIVPRVSMKKYVVLTFCLMGVLYAAGSVLTFFYGLSAVAKYTFAAISIPSFIYFFLMAKYRDGRTIFAFCFGDMTVVALSFFPVLISIPFGTNPWIIFFGRIIILPLSEFFMAKYLRKFYLTISNEDSGGWWLIAAVSALFYLIIIFFGTYPTPILNRPKDTPLALAIILALSLTFTIIFRMLSAQLKIIRHERVERLMEIQIHSFENTIRTMEQNEKKIRIIKHDIRHYLNTLFSLAKTGNVEEIRKFVVGAEKILKIEEPQKFCESAMLNSLLSFYVELARDAACDIRIKFSLENPLFVNEVELCVLFSNMIENALNAAKKIPQEENRKIKITCVDQPQFALEVANTYAGTVAFDEEGIPLANEKNHGYGTQSILSFAKRHDAVLDYAVEDEWFKVRVMM